ncbi:dTDP-4-dehydrorhamnose reductase [Gracilinema caldarium]|uniref:dTDP-4-dehydrorhamnose reductase n=1 Tax=Gracilinema caldarium (strain ATCC 51460 / DSM 7334 / H1) TaxID=744872 RepID=F8F039_GRAC1|nr:dTDP-4-dehydrorhamnose reductase [Gracilinema caldarium]AEJ18692.1 dTDP-4-dehydrorhamnose reductase [Gracilinema caldarium DSM 7334]
MIWIVGNKGMLGTELTQYLQNQGLPVLGTDREVSFLDPDALSAFAQDKPIFWIINCAAYTAVDKAEDEEDLALRLNAEGPENLARLAQNIGARLLHISTDYVFSGTPQLQFDAPRPYREDDPTGPTGAYGRTKEAGERRVLAVAPSSLIVRTAWLYGAHGPNFVFTMLRLMKERDRIGVVADQRGTPTWARDLAAAIHGLITKPEVPAGIYHFTNDGECTWYDFALAIRDEARTLGLLDKDCTVNPLTTDQYPTKARRPAYSVLSKDKIKALGIPVPGWRESLVEFLKTQL